MLNLGHDFSILERKLYDKDGSFKKFYSLSEDDIKLIDADILRRFGQNNRGLERYTTALCFLTSPSIHQIYPNFDMRLLYLIRMVDPDLVIFREYIKTDIPSVADISEAMKDEALDLQIQREANLSLVRNNVRTQLGFFNAKLLNYEIAYFNKFLKTKQFAQKVNKSFFNKIMKVIRKGFSFDSISSDDEKRLSDLVAWYLESVGDVDIFTTAFHLINQNSLLGLNNFVEQFAFLIMTGDPELKLLTIFEEESKMSEVKRRALEELGFYNKDLITIEKAYHARFMPDTKLTIWSLD